MSETPQDSGRDAAAEPQSTESAQAAEPQQTRIPESLNFRLPRVSLLAVLAVAACAVPLATTAGPLGLLVFLVPLALLWIVVWPRTTVDAERIKVRGLATARTFPWESLKGLAITKQSKVRASTTGGSEVTLPHVRPRDLPAISIVSRGHLPDPSAQSSDEG